MKTTALRLTCLGLLGGLVPPLMAYAEPQAQNNIPALLQFAEQYHPQAPANTAPPTKGDTGSTVPAKKPSPQKTASPVAATRPGAWQTRDAGLQRQQATITELRQQLAELRTQLEATQTKAVKAPTIDMAGLQQLAKNLRQGLAITPTEQQAAVQVKHAIQQGAELVKLTTQHRELQHQLLLVRAEAERRMKERDTALTTLRKNTDTQITQLKTALAASQTRATPGVSTLPLNTAKHRQDYAAGVSLGEEIRLMQDERARWGVNADAQFILAGISDTFAGERRLDDKVLNTALVEAEKAVTAAREKTLAQEARTGSAYLETFRQRAQVKQAQSGFWYQIDYAGDSAIPEGSSVDVVVKEMLTDGTVIQDMEAGGVTLSQPVADFPALFKEAIGLLKNHGSMTLVVPPVLAYGEKGYPPKIPPNATVVYQLRIADIAPAQG
ncbi:FKBP-type peptidyl-prolyl cis-trans isomerase N-terminal domain-containing protein [Serratia fonticola]|uniref:FKBP-type peptidyl-prolyl cis-trans isomerase N-terminal domain-containing protein n=1 Tax=Serratia fonticola TaxID=47917 RepID=UPI00217763B4|nr:FKBP-type peptidyl-prolyl cis-trans isomerase N-terminal domain-containing protein [Serratia fonticola]CAI1198394.1 FKBP-type peptidyl-prolyl cis-trans isomerase fkpA precursor [Serratia fonticola]